MEKNWVIAEQAPEEWQARFLDIPQILRQLLWIRGIREKDDVEKFLRPDYNRDIYDPFLFKDMERAAERVFAAIEKKEKIFVYGDYDADGVPGSVIIKTTLDALGAVTDIYIPHREKEGYGLNSGAIAYMIQQGAKLVITCDCGISNATEVDEATLAGIDTIITDHHRVPETMPKAFAILHPFIPGEEYPNKFLTGGAVAFKLAQGLLHSIPPLKLRGGQEGLQKVYNSPQPPLNLRGGEDWNGFEKWLLDLAAIATVADVGRLVGENRAIVKYGLVVLNKTRRLGLQKIIQAAGIKPGALDTWSIAWQIAPRINAAGRMDHANAAFRLLSTDNAAEAEELAAGLNRANSGRQRVTEQIINEAREQILNPTRPPLNLRGGERRGYDEGVKELPYVLAAFKESWNPGVIGLAAGRLTDELRRPVLLGTMNGKGEIVGSCRSIGEFNIIEALAASKKYLLKFGGHPKAAGFSVANKQQWDNLVVHLRDMAAAVLHEADVRPCLQIDVDITLAQVSWDLISAIQALEPCGEGNLKPRFLIHGLRVLGFDGVGNNAKHLRLTVTDNFGKPCKMIGFCFGNWCERLTIDNVIDVVAEIGINEWNGNKEIEIKIVDLRFHQAHAKDEIHR